MRSHVFSCSDDMTAIVWDLATYSPVLTLSGHTDYVRAGAPHPFDAHLVATGSYDRSVRLWDIRVDPTSATAVANRGWTAMNVSHDTAANAAGGGGGGVEAVAWHPSGNYLASSAGSTICIWDCVAGRVRTLIDSTTTTNDDEGRGAGETEADAMDGERFPSTSLLIHISKEIEIG